MMLRLPAPTRPGLRALAACAALLASAPAARPQGLVDGYAAIVNDRVITIGDVMAYIQTARAQLLETAKGETLADRLAEAYRGGLEKLVENALIVEEFKKQGLAMPDRLVNDRVNEVIAQSFNSDRAAFLAELASQRTTVDEWRETIRERLIVSAMRRQAIGEKSRISPSQVQAYYEQHTDRYSTPPMVKLRLLQLGKGAAGGEHEAKRQQAVLLRGKILGGEDFGEVAAEFSEGSLSAKGGDWGWRNPTDLRAELAAAIANLPAGQVSDVVETDDGFYLLLVEDRKPAAVTPLAQARPEIEDLLRQAESERLYAEWIARLRQKHSVKIVQDSLKTGP
jgi:peptidyl-prolyl cis-trans isomerase SurA